MMDKFGGLLERVGFFKLVKMGENFWDKYISRKKYLLFIIKEKTNSLNNINNLINTNY